MTSSGCSSASRARASSSRWSAARPRSSTAERVLSLEALIEVKAALGRPKDRIAVAELRAIAEARRNRPR